MKDCESIRRQLDVYLDGDLSRELEPVIRRHLADCDACRDLERTTRGLLEQAAALPLSIEPPRDLWTDIDRELDRREPTHVIPGAGRGRHAAAPSWRFGLIAASLLLVGLTGGYLLRGIDLAPGATVVEATPEPLPTTATPVAAVSDLYLAEQAIVEAKAQLRALLAADRGSLSADTVRSVERNLAVIELAIDEIRAALEQDPDNRDLGRRLLTARQRQLNLLQRATHLAARGSDSRAG